MIYKTLCILGFSLSLLSLTATQAVASPLERSCNKQTIRDAIRIVDEYPQDDSFSIRNDLAFRVYTVALTEHLQATLPRTLCKFGAPKRTLKITIVFSPFFGQTKDNPLVSPPLPVNRPVISITRGRRLQTPWAQMVINDRAFEAIYVFNERQVIYDQAKLANPALPINNDLRPIPVNIFYRHYSFFLREKVIQEKSFQDLLWLYRLGDPDTRFHNRVPVWDLLLQASTGQAILANFLTNEFLFNSLSQTLSYEDITALPQTFNRDSYRLNGSIWNSITSPDYVR
jgi:hypothetical protein